MRNVTFKYLLLTFAMMVICWGTCLVCGLFGVTLANMPVLYVPYMLGGFSPTVAAVWVQRKGGFKAWLKSVFDFKHSLLSYLLVLASAPVLYPRCGSVWRRLSGVRHQCAGSDLCFGRGEEMHRQYLAVRAAA